MSTSTPFHSNENSAVYHVCGNCTEGKKIDLTNRMNGKGEGRLCMECERLQKEGKC